MLGPWFGYMALFFSLCNDVSDCIKKLFVNQTKFSPALG
jgi:hypothetical protein